MIEFNRCRIRKILKASHLTIRTSGISICLRNSGDTVFKYDKSYAIVKVLAWISKRRRNLCMYDIVF